MSYDPRDDAGVGTAPVPPPSGASPKVRLAGLANKANKAAKAAAKGSKGSKPTKPTGGKAPRKAHLQLSRLEPWSVMKFSFVMSLVGFVVLLVAVGVLYMILSVLGVFDAITSTVTELTRDQGAKEGGLNAASWFSFARVFGYASLVGALNVFLITALSTVGAMIYNMTADLVGGIEVTLKEAE
ncbi:DUF3566 domain-containing protein [Actinomadura sp. HBU206391]|nr:DUF3566 domain-containing protein [Actinomadura sp. HBU206391]